MLLARLSIIICLFGSSAFGAEVSKSSTALDSKEKKNYTVTFDSTLSSSLHKTSDINHSLSNDLSISPTYSLDNGYTLFGTVGGTKDLKGERKFYMGNAAVGVSTTLRKYEKLTIKGSAVATIPLSESTKDNQQLRTAVKVSPKFIYKVADGFSAVYVPNAKINFHKYKIALSGASNTQYTLGNTAVLSYSGFESVSLTATASYYRSFTYGGNSKDAYGLTQSLSFVPTEATSVTLGHAIGGNPLQADGINNEIKIFDERSSSVFAGFSFTY